VLSFNHWNNPGEVFMQIRKTYKEINPTLLFDEVREFVQKQGMTLDKNRLETYSLPSDSSNFIYRGTLTFNIQGREALRAHIIGIEKGETRLTLNFDDELFPKEKIVELEDDLNFMLGPFEPHEN
jgi:hypothetical protein